jgi:predicted secreted protein
MAESNALSAFGSLLKIGDGATPENFTTIAEVADLGGPALKLDAIEVTHHESPGGWRENIGGLLTAGEVTFTLNFIPTEATHDASTGLIADMVARTKRNFQLVFPDVGSTTWSFAALVTGFEPKEPIDEKLSADVTLTVTGQPTLS